MWRATYDAVLTEYPVAAADGTSAAEKLLDAALNDGDAQHEDAEAKKQRLCAIGRELVRPLDELKAIGPETPRHEKLTVLQLQVVCRLFVCCSGVDFDASVSSKSKGKSKKKAKKSKKLTKPTDMRSQLRELLDRIALLVDSANPPSIAESEDEPSPFHHFLLHVLEKPLGAYLPQVFTFLREEYELTEDEELRATPLNFAPRKVSTTPVKVEQATTTTSILSALKEERPTKKRAISASSDRFKEVQLPGQLSKGSQPQPSLKRAKTLDLGNLKAASQPAASTRPHSASVSSGLPSKLPKRHSSSGASSASLVSLAAASKKPKSSRSQGTLSKPMLPLLVRNVDRQLFPARPSTSNGAAPALKTQPPTGRKLVNPPAMRQAPGARIGAPAVANLSRASVVMRTPDRPQRVQRSQPRILIESSPPLRNPFASARIRKPGAPLPK